VPSPAKNKSSRSQLVRIVNSVKAEAVFTFLGPAYVKFALPHLMGVADGWITHSSYLVLKTQKCVRAWLNFFLLFLYKRHWYKEADQWVVEAECAKHGMRKRLFTPANKVSIVPNSCGDHYRVNKNITHSRGAKWRILTLSSYYKHKNLEIIPEVANAIRQLSYDLQFEFVITIEKNTNEEAKLLNRARVLGVSDIVNNIGPVAVHDGPALYRSCDIMFMPSLLETFSASYPEAMISCIPIVTTDLGFARDICGEAALYYSPLDSHDAAKNILSNRE
jgi:glycosyltransferase involved in cell wall biosynthesis